MRVAGLQALQRAGVYTIGHGNEGRGLAAHLAEAEDLHLIGHRHRQLVKERRVDELVSLASRRAHAVSVIGLAYLELVLVDGHVDPAVGVQERALVLQH
jgi:uncharacterized membrane protein